MLVPCLAMVFFLLPSKALGGELSSQAQQSSPSEIQPDALRAPTTLSEGSWLLGVGAGWAQSRNLEGEPEATSGLAAGGLYPDLAWGITDRLMVNLSRFGAAYRFGERSGLELIPALRFGLQISFSPELGRGVVVPLWLTTDARFWLAPDTAITMGIGLTSRLGHRGAADCELFPEDCQARDYVLDQWSLRGSAGLIHTFAHRLTVAPSVTIGASSEEEEQLGDPWITVFGRLNRGVVADPILRFHVVSWFALDLDASLSLRPSDARFASFLGGGMTFNW